MTEGYLRDRSFVVYWALAESNHVLRLRSVVAIQYLNQNPCIPKHVYQPPHPQPIEHAFSQKLEFVRLTEPEGLGTCPYPDQDCRFPERDRQAGNKQGKEEEIP